MKSVWLRSSYSFRIRAEVLNCAIFKVVAFSSTMGHGSKTKTVSYPLLDCCELPIIYPIPDLAFGGLSYHIVLVVDSE